jgi:hypothetical protein
LAWNESELTTNGDMYNNLEQTTYLRDCMTPQKCLVILYRGWGFKIGKGQPEISVKYWIAAVSVESKIEEEKDEERMEKVDG